MNRRTKTLAKEKDSVENVKIRVVVKRMLWRICHLLAWVSNLTQLILYIIIIYLLASAILTKNALLI